MRTDQSPNAGMKFAFLILSALLVIVFLWVAMLSSEIEGMRWQSASVASDFHEECIQWQNESFFLDHGDFLDFNDYEFRGKENLFKELECEAYSTCPSNTDSSNCTVKVTGRCKNVGAPVRVELNDEAHCVKWMLVREGY